MGRHFAQKPGVTHNAPRVRERVVGSVHDSQCQRAGAAESGRPVRVCEEQHLAYTEDSSERKSERMSAKAATFEQLARLELLQGPQRASQTGTAIHRR